MALADDLLLVPDEDIEEPYLGQLAR